MSLRLGIAAALPPTRSGPADYVAALLPALARRADITCFAEDPDVVDAEIRANFPVLPLLERHTAPVDLVCYHLANNSRQQPYNMAAREGPAGLAVVHDASLHHVMEEQLLDRGDVAAYTELLTAGHGDMGRRIAELRARGIRGDIELFLFDMLAAILDRQLGAIVHSDYARSLVERRVRGLPVWVVPHFMHGSAAAARPPTEPDLPQHDLRIGHIGFVTPSKRPDLLLEAVAGLRRAGVDAFVVFAGEDQSDGFLDHHIDRLGLANVVSVTGYLPEDALEAYISAADVIVSLRWPHVGESSGALMRALCLGRPCVVQTIGTWAEMPDDVVRRIPAWGDESGALEQELLVLARDPSLRRRVGRAAAAFAQSVGGADTAADRMIDVMESVVTDHPWSPRSVMFGRAAAVRRLLGDGPEQLGDALVETGSVVARQIASAEQRRMRYYAGLQQLPPAAPRARLLDVGAIPAVLRLCASVWGYEVTACGPQLIADERIHVPASGGLPSFAADVDHVDVDIDRLPYEAGRFDVVTCWEILDEIAADPSHLLAEANRVLAANGVLVLTASSGVSFRRLRATLDGAQRDAPVDRSFSPERIRRLLHTSGFSDDGVSTHNVWDDTDPEIADLVAVFGASLEDRGDLIVAIARKTGLPADRYGRGRRVLAR